MGDWWAGSGLSWIEFLEAEQFAGKSGPGLRMVERAIDRQTSELLGGARELAVAGFEIANRHIEQGEKIVLTIERSTKEVIEKLDDVMGVLDSGFTDVLATLDGIHDTLKDLLKVARSPAQTAAYEQYAIAQEAFRKQLYPECLDALRLAIDGNGTQSGYKLDWRFHYLRGLVQLGSPRFGDHDSVDLAAAEQSFILAARYARGEAAMREAFCMFAAGRAAFLQYPSNLTALQAAESHLSDALRQRPQFFEALYLRARVRATSGERLRALDILRPWIMKDERLLVRICTEGEFAVEETLNTFLSTLRDTLTDELGNSSQQALGEHHAGLARFPHVLGSQSAVRLATYANRMRRGVMELLRYNRVMIAEDRADLAREIARWEDRGVVAKLETVEAEVLCIRHEVVAADVVYRTQEKSFLSSNPKTVEKATKIPANMVAVSRAQVRSLRIALCTDRGQRLIETPLDGQLMSLAGQMGQRGKFLRSISRSAITSYPDGFSFDGDGYEVFVHELSVTPYGTNLLWLPHTSVNFFNSVMPFDRAPTWLRENERKLDLYIDAFLKWAKGDSKPLAAHRDARRSGPFLRGPERPSDGSLVPGIAYVSIRGALAFCNVLSERLGIPAIYDFDGVSRVNVHTGLFRPRLPTLAEVEYIGTRAFCDMNIGARVFPDTRPRYPFKVTPYHWGCDPDELDKLKRRHISFRPHPPHVWDETQAWQVRGWNLDNPAKSSTEVEDRLGGRAFRLVIELPNY